MASKLSGWLAACMIAVPGVASAQSAALPNWKIADICAKDSASGHCSAFEGEALKAVSGSWAFVPDDIRKRCIDQARQPADRSWRVLGDCIDDSMERNIDKAAVKTARTPGEAVPPARVVVVAPPAPAPAPVVVVPPPVAAPPVVVPVVAPPVVAPAAPAPAPIIAVDIVLPPIPLPTISPMAAIEAEVAAQRAAAEAQARAAAVAEAKRRADADAQAKMAAAAEADVKRKAELAACQTAITTSAQSGAIRFATGSAALTPESTPVLDRIAVATKSCPNARVTVEGHTDATGEAEKNTTLSAQRADAVVAHLRSAGIESWRIAGAGFGSSKPVASNDTVEGRAQNRRIEFVANLMGDAERRAAIDAEAKRKAELLALEEKQKALVKPCQDGITAALKSETIRFRAGGSNVTREGAAVLDRVAVAIKACASGTVAIEGHTDATGDIDEDKDLSARRAEAVAAYLSRAGIDGRRLKAVGFGRSKPIAANDTDENRAKNRRIDFVVTP